MSDKDRDTKPSQDGSQSECSFLERLLSLLSDPRTLAIIGAIALRAFGKLSDTLAGSVLVTAVGGHALSKGREVIKKLKGSKSE